MNYKTFDEQYIEISNEIISKGTRVQGRNNLIYTQFFGQEIVVDLRLEFPILTLRKMPIKNLLREFLWDLHGKSDIESLGKARHFWDFLATDDGYLPHSYGSSWRSWPVNKPDTPNEIHHKVFRQERFDQLQFIINELKTNPTNRQLVLQTYNPAYLKEIAPIPPCHPTIVFSSDRIHLDCLILGRSWDLATGKPLDIFRYSLLIHVLAQEACLIPRYLKICSANNHIYDQNMKDIQEIISRKPIKNDIKIQILKPIKDLHSIDDFVITGYESHPSLRFEVAK